MFHLGIGSALVDAHYVDAHEAFTCSERHQTDRQPYFWPRPNSTSEIIRIHLIAFYHHGIGKKIAEHHLRL